MCKMWRLVELQWRSWFWLPWIENTYLAFDLKIAKAATVAEAGEVLIDVDHIHILGPSRVESGIVISIQDGESEQFDE